jgi:hypothetical protein
MFPCLFASGLKIEAVGLPKMSKRIWEWQDTQPLCVRLFDCSVFAHVHPAGSVSMAALQLAQASLPPGPRELTNRNWRIKVTPILRWNDYECIVPGGFISLRIPQSWAIPDLCAGQTLWSCSDGRFRCPCGVTDLRQNSSRFRGQSRFSREANGDRSMVRQSRFAKEEAKEKLKSLIFDRGGARAATGVRASRS